MSWSDLTDYVLLRVFSLLPLRDVGVAARVCSRWAWLARDCLLWKNITTRMFRLPSSRGPPPGSFGWFAEQRRLVHHLPSRVSQHLLQVVDGFSHVAFSSDGQMMAACGDDARLLVWRCNTAQEGCALIWEDDFNRLKWQQCTRVKFNSNSTLLMASGVLKRDIMGRTRGEVIIISMEEDDLGSTKGRIGGSVNGLRAHGSVGCWYNNNYVLNTHDEWLAHTVSMSLLWMNKVNFSLDSDPGLACMRQQYRIYNAAGCSVRNMMVISVPKGSTHNYHHNLNHADFDTSLAAQLNLVLQHAVHAVVVPPLQDIPVLPPGVDNVRIGLLRDKEYYVEMEDGEEEEVEEEEEEDVDDIIYKPEYYVDRENAFNNGDCEEEDNWAWEDEEWDEEDDWDDWEYFDEKGVKEKEEVIKDVIIGEEVLNEDDKLLVFTTGMRTWLPHQIGIKLMSKVKFKKHLDSDRNIWQVIQDGKKKNTRNEPQEPTPNWRSYKDTAHLFDIVDVRFDFSGYITGMACSGDSRYLYVNVMPWPKDFFVKDVYEPPPAGYAVERLVLDLARMELVGRSHPKQRRFVPAETCKPTTIQVTRQYMTTSGRNCGLVFDRHYGVVVSRLPHAEITAAAMNPHDQEMMATVGEWGDLKIWRSKRKVVNGVAESEAHL